MLEGADFYDTSYLKKSIPHTAILVGGLEVAFVGVLETLISGRITDNMTCKYLSKIINLETRFDQSKEVFGLSIANVVCGLMGGIPCTGVLFRSAVNVASGANDKLSQFINAVVVLVVVSLLLPSFSYLPMPVIASMQIVSSVRLIPFKVMSHLWAVDKSDYFIMMFTTFVCIMVDGAMGLITGCFITLLRNSVNQSNSTYTYDIETNSHGSRTLTISLVNNLTFINAMGVETMLIKLIKEENPNNILIDASNLDHIDADGIYAL
jgi:MFS superfamily sulfate permease-like transporter